MCFFSEGGDFILARNGMVLASKAKRDAARTRPCGAYHGVAQGVLSQELALRLRDPEFVLSEPMALSVAQSWSEHPQEPKKCVS